MCAYQRVRNVYFSENFTYVPNEGALIEIINTFFKHKPPHITTILPSPALPSNNNNCAEVFSAPIRDYTVECEHHPTINQ